MFEITANKRSGFVEGQELKIVERIEDKDGQFAEC
jgi:hypothetical protein